MGTHAASCVSSLLAEPSDGGIGVRHTPCLARDLLFGAADPSVTVFTPDGLQGQLSSTSRVGDGALESPIAARRQEKPNL